MEYRKEATSWIQRNRRNCASTKPVLFVGAGLSRRYLNAPNWRSLLEEVLDFIYDSAGIDFYLQKTDKRDLDDDLIEVAEIIADLVHTWAWTEEGRKFFDSSLYSPNISHKVFFKRLVANIISRYNKPLVDHSSELKALKNIDAQEIVTTNYDHFLSDFLGLRKRSGHEIIERDGATSVLHAHGSIDNPDSIIILPSDYEDFSIKHRYSFAKLLIYFIENPCIFLGYSLSDPHIKQLLVDAAEATNRNYLSNVFMIAWAPKDGEVSSIDKPYRVISEGRDAMINILETPDFEWVYQSFSQTNNSDESQSNGHSP